MKQFAIAGLMLFSILFQNRSLAQIEKPIIFEELIEKGIERYDKGEYDEALKTFSLVHRSDPSYPWACYEIALTYYSQNKYELAIEKCREALWYKWERPSVYALMGNAFDDMGKPEEGVKIIQPLLEQWPYNPRLLMSIAYCYVSLQQYDKAESVLKRIIRYYPFNSNAHALLAKTNYAMGRTAQAYYAYNMALVMNPSLNNLRFFENTITGRVDSLIQRFKYPYIDNFDHRKWDELKSLMESELAFNKNFSFNHKVDNTISRQTQMLLQKTTYDKKDTSIYNQFYLRFYKDLMDKDYFDTYIYYIFQKSGFEFVSQWNESNKKKINEFVNWAQAEVINMRNYAYNPDNEPIKATYYHYDSNSNLSAIGQLKTVPDSLKEGFWTFINANGSLDEAGLYLNDKVQGSYKIFYDNSKLNKLLNFKDNLLEGLCQTFYQDGKKSVIYNCSKGNKHGKRTSYTHAGLIIDDENYSNGENDGISINNNYKDGIISKINFQNNHANGKRERLWMNGNKESEYTYINDTVNGTYKSWYENGQLKNEGAYKMDKPIGTWKYFYWNGNLQKVGSFDSTGLFSGTWTYYTQDGKKSAIEETYIKNSLNGSRTEYFPNGKVSSIADYVDDKIVKIEFRDTTGKQVFSALAVNDKIEFKSFYPDGSKLGEGILSSNKNQEGLWKYYNPYGIKIKEYNYSDDMLTGIQKTFYTNGQIKEEYSCDSNKIDGLYKEYYANGTIRNIGWSKKGENEGEWLSYYPTGKIKSKAYYVSGELVGFYESYDGNGAIEQQYFYSDDNMLQYIRTFNKEGILTNEYSFNNGDCQILEKYSNGSIKTKSNYLMGLLNDTVTTYFKNGKPYSQAVYKYDKLNGKLLYWDINGNITSEANYILGKENGPRKVYENGILIKESSFEDDEETGTLKFYHYNGKLSRVMSYPNGERNGYTYYYAPDGQLMYRAFFINDAIKSYSYLDANGKYVKEIPFSEKSTELIAYFPNGKVSIKAKYLNGELDGKRIEYYSNGKISREVDLKCSYYNGIFKNFYANGQTLDEVNYVWDYRQGLYTSYYENGKKKSVGNYLMDAMDGLWKYYDINGNIVNEVIYRNGKPSE